VSVDFFQLVLIVAAGVGVVGALLAFAGSSRLYERIGRGYLDVPDGPPHPPASGFESWNGEAAQDTCQLLDARAALRRRHRKRVLESDVEIRAILRQLER
jgi:hypothetical protein